MSSLLEPYAVLLPRDAYWRESNIMKIPNTNLADVTVPKYGAVLVRPPYLRQVFNDTEEEALWLILGAPRHEEGTDQSEFYPEDPQQLPVELHDRKWPPK